MPGVWQSAAYNEGAAVIFHAPKACAHISREMSLNGYFHAQAKGYQKINSTPLFSSDLRDEHSIYGGHERLFSCIEHVVKECSPRYILIAASCVSGVIGDDIAGVAQKAEEKWRIPILPVPGSGFLDGDYYRGFYQAGRLMAERLLEVKSMQPDCVTILGDRGGAASPDGKEMAALLESLGLRVLGYFPAHFKLDSDCQTAQFALTLAGTPDSQRWLCKLGEMLEKRFNLKFFSGHHPVGWQSTHDWIESLGCFSGREELVPKAAAMQWMRLAPELEKFRLLAEKKTFALCIGRSLRHFDPAWVLEIFRLADLKVPEAFIMKELGDKESEAIAKELEKGGCRVISEENEVEVLLENADIVITTHELSGNYKRQVFLPLLPQVGIAAPLSLMRSVGKLTMRHGGRGGLIYA